MVVDSKFYRLVRRDKLINIFVAGRALLWRYIEGLIQGTSLSDIWSWGPVGAYFDTVLIIFWSKHHIWNTELFDFISGLVNLHES